MGQRLVVVQARQLAVGQPEPLDAGSVSGYSPEGVEQRVGSAPPRPHRAGEAGDQLTRRQVVDRLPERQERGRVQDSERLGPDLRVALPFGHLVAPAPRDAGVGPRGRETATHHGLHPRVAQSKRRGDGTVQ